MARFDAHHNPEAARRRHTPHLLDVQNDFISDLQRRVVLPLRREAAFSPQPERLNPLLRVGGDAVVLDTATIGAVPASELRQAVGSLRSQRDQIQTALDAPFGAY